MAKNYKDMSYKELKDLCSGRFVFKKNPPKKDMIKMLKASDEMKPELSETPVIDGEQANAPMEKEVVTIGDRLGESMEDLTPLPGIKVEPQKPESKTIAVIGEPPAVERTDDVAQVVKPERMPTSIDDIPTTPRPEVTKEELPPDPDTPVICAGCKATVELGTTRLCPHCPGSLRFCPTCAKPGSCHKCGKALAR